MIQIVHGKYDILRYTEGGYSDYEGIRPAVYATRQLYSISFTESKVWTYTRH